MRWILLVALLGGACIETGETPCNPGPYWDGPSLLHPHVASTGDRLLVTWVEHETTDEGRITNVHRGAMTDGTALDARFDYEPGREPQRALSGSDRALVIGTSDQTRSFYEIRLPSGDRVAPPVELEGFIASCAFDGDAFVVVRPSGLARLAPDGTLGPAIAMPPVSNYRCAATATVTWMIAGGTDDPLEGSRLARGGGVLDPSPRRIVDESYFWVVAARSSETVVVNQTRADDTTWVVIADDGTVTARVPLVIPLQFYRPALLVAERDGYLLVVENTGSFEYHAIRMTPDGTQLGAPVPLDRGFGNSLEAARTMTATTLVFDRLSQGGEAPRIDAIQIADGQPPRDVAMLETVEGQSYTVDCGCSAGSPGGGLLLVLLSGIRRSRRARRARTRVPSLRTTR